MARKNSATMITTVLLSCLIPLLLAAPPTPEELSARRAAEIATTTASYNAKAQEFRALLAQTASPSQIEDTLNRALRASFRKGNEPTAVDTPAVQAVLTNLFLLEKGLRVTGLATNTNLKPPLWETLPSGAAIGDIPDPAERAQMIAFRAARRALAELWNTHQHLQAEYRRHWEKAVDAVAAAYSASSDKASELKPMLRPYAEYSFARRLSKRLHLQEP
jgi:hypothetical protein